MTPSRKAASWAIIFFASWYIIGALSFPEWWHDFIFKYNFFNIKYWHYGLERVFTYILFDSFIGSVLIIFVISLTFFPFVRKHITIPSIDVLHWKPIFLLAILVLSTGLYNFFSTDGLPKISTETPRIKPNNPTTTKISSFLQSVKFIDPIYINEAKIDTLYSQIDEKDIDSQSYETEEGKTITGEIGLSQPITASGKVETSEKEKKTTVFKQKPDSYASKLLKYLKHPRQLDDLQIYDRFESKSEELINLENFLATSNQFKIHIDDQSYAQALKNATKDAFLNQKNSLTKATSIILITGEHIISYENNKYSISKEYATTQNFSIKFTYNSIPENKLMSLLDPVSGPQKMQLTSLARIIKVDDVKDGSVVIICEPYAIFWTR